MADFVCQLSPPPDIRAPPQVSHPLPILIVGTVSPRPPASTSNQLRDMLDLTEQLQQSPVDVVGKKRHRVKFEPLQHKGLQHVGVRPYEQAG